VEHRLLRAEIAGYRCLENVDFRPDPNLTTLVGKNGAGKTSVLDAIAFIGDLVGPYAANEAWSGEARGAAGSRGLALEELAWNGGDVTITLHFEVAPPGSLPCTYAYTITLRPVRGGAQVEAEQLVADGSLVLLERKGLSARWLYFTGDKSEMVPVGPSPDFPLMRHMADPVAYPDAAPAYRFLAGIRLIRMTPTLMRADLPFDRLPDRFGRDLTGRLHALLTENPRQYLDFMQDLARLTGWSDVGVPNRFGARAATFTEGGKTLWMTVASDGSVVQAYLASLVHHPPPALTLLLLDEPAVAFFDESAPLPAELVKALSAQVQVVLSTHQPTFADYVADPEQIVLVRRRPGKGATLWPLAKEPEVDGDIMAMGKARAAMALSDRDRQP
jgi:energy-coupling factor transporter ATP-binding protein EcfA2